MPLNKRFILQVPKLSDPSNHQPTPADSAYLNPIPRQQNKFPNNSISTDEKSAGTIGKLPEQDAENGGTPDGMGVSDLEAFLTQVLAEASEPIFSADFPLQEQERRVELAKLVIAQNLGKEKTIWLLWGVRPGGRNHNLYTEARAMLDRLMKGDKF
jgi:hypothetical protein